jgi:hypothetical protein
MLGGAFLLERGMALRGFHCARFAVMDTSKLTNPTVKAAIEALQKGDAKTWASMFEPDAQLYDDGSPRSLEEFTATAIGHERFKSIDRLDNHGLDLTGEFHTEQWGDFRAYFRFQLSEAGRIRRLDIGQA